MDPQASSVRVLRPFNGFEAVYQGQDAETSIAFPGTLDPLSSEQRYDPKLLAGLSVPLGSRVILWIPMMFSDEENQVPENPYRYQLLWRLRSLSEYVDTTRSGESADKVLRYHRGIRGLGVPETIGDPTSARYIVPCGMETVAFEQSEPGSTFTNGTINLRGQFVVPNAGAETGPLAPPPATGLGSFGQGVFPGSANGTFQGGAVYTTYVTDAQGDELIILARRVTVDEGATWDFTVNNEDRGFSNTYGTNNGTRAPNPNLGIFVLTSNT